MTRSLPDCQKEEDNELWDCVLDLYGKQGRNTAVEASKTLALQTLRFCYERELIIMFARMLISTLNERDDDGVLATPL